MSMLATQQMTASKSLTTQMRSSAVKTFLPNSIMYGRNKMTNELELIQKLEQIAHLVETQQNETAVRVIDSMVYDLCNQVEEFERQFEIEYEMDDGA